jgi:hypothetical protein
MKKPSFRQLTLATAIVALLGATGSANAAFEMGPKACKNAVAERFDKAVMADISVSRPSHKKHGEAMVDWSVTNESTSAMGYCKINRDGTVLRLKVEHHKQYSNTNDDEMDGFYFDRHTGQWRDPAGEVCHSCTPENGFPRHGH